MRGLFMQLSVKRKKKIGVKNYIYIYKVFQTIQPTLVIKSVPQFWHKGVGKANHVIETEEREREKKRRTEKRNDTSKSASGGESSPEVSELRF